MVGKKRKLKSNNAIFLIIFVLAVLIFIFKLQTEEVEVSDESAVSTENAGSGFLEIETFPSDAEIFVGDIYSGKSPITLYNVPAGNHDITIKKPGYGGFTSEINIEAGKKTFLEVDLVLTSIIEEEPEAEIIEEEAIEIIEEEEGTSTGLKAYGTVNIGKNFLLYYDFSEREFISNKQLGSDIFSKRYDKHLVFTRSNPVNIKAIDKGIDSIKKEDCINIQGQFEFLYSGQSLCIITKENEIAALGGNWENTINANLTWMLFS